MTMTFAPPHTHTQTHIYPLQFELAYRRSTLLGAFHILTLQSKLLPDTATDLDKYLSDLFIAFSLRTSKLVDFFFFFKLNICAQVCFEKLWTVRLDLVHNFTAQSK